jgi:hypothetical protein
MLRALEQLDIEPERCANTGTRFMPAPAAMSSI